MCQEESVSVSARLTSHSSPLDKDVHQKNDWVSLPSEEDRPVSKEVDQLREVYVRKREKGRDLCPVSSTQNTHGTRDPRVMNSAYYYHKPSSHTRLSPRFV